MGSDLEYLMSSLPFLRFQNTSDFRRGLTRVLEKYEGREQVVEGDWLDFLDREAEKYLPAARVKVFRSVALDQIHEPSFPEGTSRALQGFSAYLRAQKEEVGLLRKNRRQGGEVRDVIDLQGNPLEQEVLLMAQQWQRLEELSAGHYADFDALLIYKLKLMILLRWWGFEAHIGRAVFSQMVKDHSYG